MRIVLAELVYGYDKAVPFIEYGLESHATYFLVKLIDILTTRPNFQREQLMWKNYEFEQAQLIVYKNYFVVGDGRFIRRFINF